MIASRSGSREPVLVACCLLVWGVVQPVGSATLIVDDDGSAPYTSIQAAIDAAVPGQDDVFVRCGTYPENIVLRDGVSVSGQRAGCTFLVPVLDDQPVVNMTSLGPDTVFRGFTVENRPSLRPGTLGILVVQGSPLITRNIIEGPGNVSYSGVGISVSGGAPVISYNIIRGNYDCCYGGGVVLDGTDAAVRSNLIVGNLSYYGAGIFTQYGDPEVTHNTIVGNAGWVGGGMLTSGPAGTVANNVIAFNTAEIYGGGVTDWSIGTFFAANDVFGNQPDDYSSLDLTGVDGNISADPLFVDTNETSFAGFEPRNVSPLMDAGSPLWAANQDLRGIPRPVDGDVDSVSLPDIGARENEGVTGLVHTGSGFVWDPGTHQPPEFNVYRGDLARLKQTGVYTQDPLAVAGARHFCGEPSQLSDPDLPDPGRVFFYLPVAVGAVEGSLGFNSDLLQRAKNRPCLGS